MSTRQHILRVVFYKHTTGKSRIRQVGNGLRFHPVKQQNVAGMYVIERSAPFQNGQMRWTEVHTENGE